MTHEQALSTFASERYLLDEMTEPERETFEEHYFSCPDCADDVRAGAVMQEGARAGLMQERAAGSNVRELSSSRGSQTRSAARRWYQSAAIPWAAAATLAVVAGYQTFVSTPGRALNEAVALAPVTLRPASRGQEPRVAVSRASNAVTLAVDVSSAVSGGELAFSLRDAGGTIVMSGRAQTPQAGAPLLLLVPASGLVAGRYTLLIGEAEYPFQVVTQ